MEKYLIKEDFRVLSDKFYQNSEVNEIALSLIGKIILTNIDSKITSGIIVETEAYAGIEDNGCHSYNGRRTPRTEIMYGIGGLSYVYICYGMHPMMNIVTGAIDDPKAVLIRAIQPLDGIETMMQRRKMNTFNHILTSGPAKTAVALGINKEQNGLMLNDRLSDVQILESLITNEKIKIIKTARVGMSHHVGPDAHLPYRYYIMDNKWVSKPLNPVYNF